MSADWFCKIGDKKVGPLSGQQLKTIVARGQLRPEHLLRRGTEGPWVPAGRVKGLFPETPPAAAGKGTKHPSGAAPAKPGGLPAAKEAPQPPNPELPEEFSLGSAGGKKHHVALNVDSLHIEAQPVKVTGRKTKGLPGLKKEEQQKLTTILLGVIGGGMAIALIVFIWAASHGLLSSKKIETKAKEPDAKAAEPDLDKTAGAKEAKTAEKADDDEEWTPISTKELESGGSVLVKIDKVVRGAPPEGSKLSDEDVLVIPMTLKVKMGTTEAIPFKGWSSKKPVLKDDAKNAYDLLDQTPRVNDDATTIGAGKPIHVQLVFKPMAKKAKYLRLELPTSPFGGKRMLKIQIPKDAIGAAEEKAEKKADAEESDDVKPKAKKAKKAAAADDDSAEPEAKPAKKAKRSVDDDGDSPDAGARPARKVAKKAVSDDADDADVAPTKKKAAKKKPADDDTQ